MITSNQDFDLLMAEARKGRCVFFCRVSNKWHTAQEFLSKYEGRMLADGESWLAYDPVVYLTWLEDSLALRQRQIDEFTNFLVEKGVPRAIGS